jgi:hypothetical protein
MAKGISARRRADGVTMLSSVLHSKRAVQLNIAIV